MTIATRAQVALSQFGRAIGLDDLSLDDKGFAVLGFDDVLVSFELDEARNVLLLTAALGEPSGDRQRALEHLMDANFYWQGTYGGTFSLERETGQIVLQRPLALEMIDLAMLEKALEEFVETVEAWSKQLVSGATEAPSDPLRFAQAGLIRA